MKKSQRKEKSPKPQVVVSLRTCITQRCDNSTPSFYCDECWDSQQPSSEPA